MLGSSMGQSTVKNARGNLQHPRACIDVIGCDRRSPTTQNPVLLERVWVRPPPPAPMGTGVRGGTVRLGVQDAVKDPGGFAQLLGI